MNDTDAVRALAALANPHRLAVFRVLVRAGDTGLSAGELATVAAIPSSTLTFHTKELERAGLIETRREGRFIRSALNVTTMRDLLAFLTDDCCAGRPDLCGAVMPGAQDCCPPRKPKCEAMSDPVFNVLFLCTHNSARSVIAECVMNELGKGRFNAYSAGSQPSGRVNPHAINMLAKLGYDVSGVRSKSWNEFSGPDAPHMDFVFTVCDDAAGETCPLWPGQPMTAHWGLPDPSRTQGSEAEISAAFAETHRMLYQRISVFANLPMAALDRLALKAKLDQIGQMQRDADETTG